MPTSQFRQNAPAGQPQWQQGQPPPHRLGTQRCQHRFCYRLLHSTGNVVIRDRATALARLARLPGGKLFILPAGEA